jgi:hypothetical protein
MAANKLVFEGLEELRQQLRDMPDLFTEESRTYVLEARDDALREIHYPARAESLQKGLKVDAIETPYGTIGVIKNTSKLASIFENGTQARHTMLGSFRGAMPQSMPPAHVMVPVIMRKRRAMFGKILAMLQRYGLVVTGG